MSAEESFVAYVLHEGGVFDQLAARKPDGMALKVLIQPAEGAEYIGKRSGCTGRVVDIVPDRTPVVNVTPEAWEQLQQELAQLRNNQSQWEAAQNAISQQSPEVVPVREGPGGSPEVPGGDPQGGEAAGAREEKVDEAPVSIGKRKK